LNQNAAVDSLIKAVTIFFYLGRERAISNELLNLDEEWKQGIDVNVLYRIWVVVFGGLSLQTVHANLAFNFWQVDDRFMWALIWRQILTSLSKTDFDRHIFQVHVQADVTKLFDFTRLIKIVKPLHDITSFVAEHVSLDVLVEAVDQDVISGWQVDSYPFIEIIFFNVRVAIVWLIKVCWQLFTKGNSGLKEVLNMCV
jgi:hypothetical protein